MKELFYQGGILFMSVLTILLIIAVVWILFNWLKYLSKKQQDKLAALRMIKYGKSIGLLAMVTGILGQLIGLYSAFSVIAEVKDVSPQLVYGGIKVSMITTLYGIFIFIIVTLLWLVATQVIERRGE